MQVLAVLCLTLLGGAFAGYVGVPAGKQAYDAQRDWAANQANAQQWNQAAKNFGRSQNDFGGNQAAGSAKAQSANSDYGSQAGNWDNRYWGANRATDKAAGDASRANRWGQQADANRYAKDAVWSQGNAWRQGRKKNDDIDYAYDKKFDLKDSINGGFEYGESSKSHALDDFSDRAGAYDRNVDKNAARAASADSQSADRKSGWTQNAAAADSSWDKFARSSDKKAKSSGRDKDWSQKLDATQGGNRLWSDARKSASDVYKDLAAGDWNYARQGAGVAGNQLNGQGVAGYGGGYNAGSGNPYAYGVAGAGGYAASAQPGYGGANYRGAGAGVVQGQGIKDAERKWDQAAASKLRQGDLSATQDVTKADYRRDSWLNDRNRGFDRDSVSSAADAGLQDWARSKAQKASAADAASADAKNKWARDQAYANFDEDLWKKEAERKRLSDRSKDNKVWKKYFENKRKGGDDWERLNYDRNQGEDAYGWDAAQKKDWAQGADDRKWNAAYDQNAKNAWYGKGWDAASNADHSAFKKNAQGWQNANAAAQSKDAASKNGWNNGVWKHDTGKTATEGKYTDAHNTNGNGFTGGYGPGAGYGGGNGGRGGYGLSGYGGYDNAPYGGYPTGKVGYGGYY